MSGRSRVNLKNTNNGKRLRNSHRNKNRTADTATANILPGSTSLFDRLGVKDPKEGISLSTFKGKLLPSNDIGLQLRATEIKNRSNKKKFQSKRLENSSNPRNLKKTNNKKFGNNRKNNEGSNNNSKRIFFQRNDPKKLVGFNLRNGNPGVSVTSKNNVSYNTSRLIINTGPSTKTSIIKLQNLPLGIRRDELKSSIEQNIGIPIVNIILTDMPTGSATCEIQFGPNLTIDNMHNIREKLDFAMIDGRTVQASLISR
ncbi:uncharacterized protein SCDLUD_002859 [Saccharomycodes ludwigii]|uniref:uncharacterized protein n=1 Tax=Saccharomycodes ludwigii TaxID=36035 RepID=UPI001E88F9DA|nr:hypothetical protein SCDLUD_002859 [Saccharomycodes ludwigii]KAH3901367.1 hypothetical protein SCDLUD_002859 [Saccharomycodes ludwigii]